MFEENRIKFHLIKHAIAAVERYIVIGLSKIFKEKFREAEIKLKNAFNIFFKCKLKGKFNDEPTRKKAENEHNVIS